jgi:hypothetical protein
MEDHYLRAARQMPVLLGEHVAERFDLASTEQPDPDDADDAGEADHTDDASAPVGHVTSPRLSAFNLPYGGLVFCLTLRVDGDLPEMVDLLHRTVFQWRSIRLDGHTLEQCAARIPAVAPELGSVIVGTDIHQLVTVDPDQIPIFASDDIAGPAGSDAAHPAGIDPEVVEALVFRTRRPIRPSHAELRYPVGANRYHDSLLAVGTAVAVLCSPQRELEGWMLSSLIQLTGALAHGRQIRSDAYDILYDMEQELARAADTVEPAKDIRAQLGERRSALGALSHRISRLELELGFGVAAYTDTQAVLPSPMLAHGHRAMADLMGLPTTTVSTHQLVERASKAVRSRYDALGAAERSVDEGRQRRLDMVLAALAVVALEMGIFFGFFGANASPISEEHRPFFHADYAWLYAAVIGTGVGAYLLIALALRHFPRRDDDDDLPPPA